MRYKDRILHYFSSVTAAALIFSVSSCSLYRVHAPEVTATVSGPDKSMAARTEINGECRPEDCFGSALERLRSGSTEEAKLRLAELADRYPQTVWAARASFLLAELALDEGSNEALGLLDDASTLTDIGDYILFYRARALKNSGRLDEALSAFSSIAVLYPDSALGPQAPFQMAVSLMEAGEYKKARRVFTDFIKDFPGNTLAPDALLNIAICSVALDEPSEAVKAARKVLYRYPVHPLAKYAEVMETQLKRSAEGVPGPTVDERFTRADKLFSAARYRDAATEYAYLAKNAGEKERQRAALRLAVSRIRLKSYDQAEKTLKEYLGAKEPEREREALLWLAVASVRQGKVELLIDTERRLSEKYPQSTERARTLLYLANLYRGRGEKDKATEVYRQVVREFKGTDASDDALWSIGWSDYRAGRYSEALISFQSYDGTNPGGKDRGRFLYWSGKSLEKTGRIKEATKAYNRVCAAEESYYCQLAGGRLEALSVKPQKSSLASSAEAKPSEPVQDPADARKNEELLTEAPGERSAQPGGPQDAQGTALAESREEVPSSLSLDAHYLAARELLVLGKDALAAKELSILTSRYPDDPDSLVELADLFYRSGDYYSALRVYYIYLSKRGPDERRGAVKELRSYSFPPELVESVREKAPPGVDPCLVAAIMREESSYNPKAVSVTGALGLMQIMPSTGRFVARETGLDNFDSRDLFNPRTNIKMGSWYLGYLGRKYNNDIVLTIAGYNAGPGAVSKWVSALPAEFDEFIEAIPYTETRNYAKRVLRSYTEFLKASRSTPRGGVIRPDALIEKESPTGLIVKDNGKS